MFAGEIRNQYRMTSIIQGDLINEWYYGIPCSGKTSKAASENPDAYWENPNKWWDGYNNEEVIIIDDWSPNHECLIWHLKIWSDRYPFNAEKKKDLLCLSGFILSIPFNFLWVTRVGK